MTHKFSSGSKNLMTHGYDEDQQKSTIIVFSSTNRVTVTSMKNVQEQKEDEKIGVGGTPRKLFELTVHSPLLKLLASHIVTIVI